MAAIILVHSFRGGTGKSNTTANLAAAMALAGKRVGVIDADIQSPGIHVLFGLSADDIDAALNDFLWHGRDIGSVARDVTDRSRITPPGSLHLIPSSMKPGEIARVLREGYDAERLAAMRQALATDATDDLVRASHTLKGTSLNVGAAALAEVCREIEHRARLGETEGLAQLVVEAEAAFGAAARALDEARTSGWVVA